MFDQFKERLHHVQQDLSTGLKTLSTKAKEVKRSRREERAALRKDIPSVSTHCNQDAGAELLDRFQKMWAELHKEIETAAGKATVVDSHVQEVFLNYERRAEPLLQLQKQLVDLPHFVENIQCLTAAIGKLEAEFEEVESMLLGYEDLIDHCELLRNKQTQTAELNRYTQQKLKEEGLMRVRLQEEYEQSVRLKEESQKADKLERQKAFQDVFAADMQHYKTHGEMQRVVSSEGTHSLTDVSSIENFEITVDEQEQEALDDFLGAPPIGGTETRDGDAGDDDEDEDDEDEVEVMDVIEEETEGERAEGDEVQSPDGAETDELSRVEDTTSPEQPQEGDQPPPATETEIPDEKISNETAKSAEEDEDEDDEFDTPDEGSETENN
ncbi:dysbindin-like isoform X2 [Acanthaster planci]|uniref:Dysbindin-like isoform X2 n=1 Tax=Acanthaster planci TaxID=133434 RepID=A0A8B7XVD9_ACAPL|nr:dysbindin-like isoform X2 [Acanthaster planci]